MNKDIDEVVDEFANDTYPSEDGVYGIKTYGQIPYFVSKLRQALTDIQRAEREKLQAFADAFPDSTVNDALITFNCEDAESCEKE